MLKRFGWFLSLVIIFLSAIICSAEEDADVGYVKESEEAVEEEQSEYAKVRQAEIAYAREEIPPVHYPPFEGRWYDAFVPDTLDLAERAELALHGMTECADPAYDYATFGWIGNPKGGRVIAKHSYHGYNGGQAKWMQNLPLMRTMSGSEYNISIDVEMMKTMYHMLDEDGLYYIPIQGMPWVGAFDSGEPWTRIDKKMVFNSFPSGRALLCMVCWYARNPSDEVMKEQIENLIDAYLRIAGRQDDILYLPERVFDGEVPEPDTFGPQLNLGLRGAARYYQLTGYPPAAEFARGYASFIERTILTEEGDWNRNTSGHYHGTLCLLEGLLDWAVASGDQRLLRRIEKPFLQMRELTRPLMGHAPESYPVVHPNTEPCCMGDHVVMAAKLSVLGIGDYWEDVERFTRNILAEAQVVDSRFVQEWAGDPEQPDPQLEPWESDNNILERMIGTWNGMVGPNGHINPVSSHCCTGNAGRAFYYAWKHILTPEEDQIRVNLLLNRASKWADIDSYLPFQGRVEIRSKKHQKVLVRIPSWVTDEGMVGCTVNGETRNFQWKGRYVDIGNLEPGETANIEFPLEQKTVTITLTPTPGTEADFEDKYTVQIRGFNVVGIEPANERYPFFDDPAYRQSVPKWKMVRRFAPENEGYW